MSEAELLGQEEYTPEETPEVEQPEPRLKVVDGGESDASERIAESPQSQQPSMFVPPELADMLKTPEQQQDFWQKTARAHQIAQEFAARQEAEQRQQFEAQTQQAEFMEARRRMAELDQAGEAALRMVPRSATQAERDEAYRAAVLAKKREHDIRDMASLFDNLYSKYSADQAAISRSRAAFFANEANRDVAPFRDLIEQWVDEKGMNAHQAADVIRSVVGRMGVQPPQPDMDDTELYAAGFSSRAAEALKKQIRAAGYTESGGFGGRPTAEAEKKADALVSRVVDEWFGSKSKKKSGW